MPELVAAVGIIAAATISAISGILVARLRLDYREVAIIQAHLTLAGFPLGAVDGIAGKRTDKAVEDYQALNALTIDGIVGINTWNRLWRTT